jgi:hypothetical protein
MAPATALILDSTAGPHFVHDECLFFNLENLDTNERDFDTSDLPNEYQIQA